MRLKECLNHTRQLLSGNNIEEAYLEGESLVRHALEINRVQIYQNFEQEVGQKQFDSLQLLTERRLHGEPLAYIKGHKEFYGLDFYVNSNVLIPRPETEQIVDITISLAGKYRPPLIADIGTGCGNIAISLAVNLPKAQIYAIDISAPALKIARLNCYKHKVYSRINLLEGDILTPLHEPVNLIVANLPYVKQPEIAAGSFEPVTALDGGSGGLELIGRLCNQVNGKLLPGGCLLLEIGQGQGEAVTSLLNNNFPDARIDITPDLSNIDRIVSMTLPE